MRLLEDGVGGILFSLNRWSTYRLGNAVRGSRYGENKPEIEMGGRDTRADYWGPEFKLTNQREQAHTA